MGFREEFFFPYRTYAQISLERTVVDGFRAEKQELIKLRASQKAQYEAAAAAVDELKEELGYQAERIGWEIAEGSDRIVEAVTQGSADIVSSIQKACDYLGGELTEIRWAIERHTKVSGQILAVLLNSLDNTSRQYFEQGVKCYDTGERDFARERFGKALEANRTNYFAYQYIGFIAVAEENSEEAIRNFELAQKFAEQAYHRALALSHLARAKRAIGDGEKALALSREAATLSPETSKFWYELANYCLQLGQENEMAGAIQRAIENDWEYFTVVSTDSAFDPMRGRVNTVLSELRGREGAKAQARIEELSNSLATAKAVGAENEAHASSVVLRELENKLARNNVFLHFEVQKAAPVWKTKTLEVAHTVVQQKIAACKQRASEIQAEKEKRLQQLRSDISALRYEQGRLTVRVNKNETHVAKV